MINKSNRLNRSEIDGLKNNSKTLKKEGMLVLYKKTKHHPSKIAIVVSKKINNKAVIRNKHKRQIAKSITKHILNNKTQPIKAIFYPNKTFCLLSQEEKNKAIFKIYKNICSNQ